MPMLQLLHVTVHIYSSGPKAFQSICEKTQSPDDRTVGLIIGKVSYS